MYTWTSLLHDLLQHGFGYNTDHSWTLNGLILLNIVTFYSSYNMDWIANTGIVLDPNNSVIKRLSDLVIVIVYTNMQISKTEQVQ